MFSAQEARGISHQFVVFAFADFLSINSDIDQYCFIFARCSLDENPSFVVLLLLPWAKVAELDEGEVRAEHEDVVQLHVQVAEALQEKNNDK